MVFLLAIPVHGLVHVVVPGPVRGPAGALTRAAAAVHAPAPALTPRARVGAPAPAATRAPAPGIEVLCKLYLFI